MDMLRIEKFVKDYVDCWKRQRPTYSGLYEDNDFGCEHLQIFRNKFALENFNHDELSQLATLLTRELRGQINQDHKFFWSWCAFLTSYFQSNVTLFSDRDWGASFKDLINLILASRRHFPVGPVYSKLLNQAMRYVNTHLLETELNKWQIAGPLTFSVLEGLLRRKNAHYVNKDGTVKRSFSISKTGGGTKSFDPHGSAGQKWLNRINDSLRCFEENTIIERKRNCPYLQQMKIEIATLYPTPADVYDMIDAWRNDLIHGKEYWQNRVPLLTNLICLLIIDETKPSLYDKKRADMKRKTKWASETRVWGSRAPWDLFPPDL